MNYLSQLYLKWKTRKTYNTYAEMPTKLLAFFGVSTFICSWYAAYILKKVVPLYVEAANQVSPHLWGPAGWALTVAIFGLLAVCWGYGNVWWRCNTVIRERHFQ